MKKLKLASVKLLFIMLLGTTLLTTSSCVSCVGSPFSWIFGEGLKPSENSIETKHTLRNFKEAIFNLPCKIEIKSLEDKTKSPYILLEGPENYVNLVKLDLAQETLKIFIENDQKLRSHDLLHLTLVTNNPQKFWFKGVGDILIQPMIVKTLEIKNTGVSDLHLKKVQAEELLVFNTGVGDMKLSGMTNTLTLQNTGVGDISARLLETKILMVKNTGVGDVNCTASEKVSLCNTGVGDVEFNGSAHIEHIKDSGVGHIDINLK